MGSFESELVAENFTDWDVDALTEEIWLEFDGAVSQSTVKETLCSLFARYEDAPVKLFVPVVVRRKAKAILREGLST